MLLRKSKGRENTFIVFIVKSAYKWTCTIQTHVVQGSTVYIYVYCVYMVGEHMHFPLDWFLKIFQLKGRWKQNEQK